jgi:tRNA(fMet)-specific endonuclease VapC
MLCSVVLAELWYGVFRSRNDDQTRNRSLVEQLQARHISLPFDNEAAREAAAIRAELASAGTPIGPHDLQIAAIARNKQIAIVTNNFAEFSRVPNLAVENWQQR